VRHVPLLFGLALSAFAQTIEAPFSGYTFSTVFQNRHQPVVPVSLGGLAVDRSDVNKLLVVGSVAGSAAAVYSVPVLRDAGGGILGLSGPAAQRVSTPKAAGSLVYGPPHLHDALVYSIESGSAGVDVGLVKPGQTAAFATFNLVPDSFTEVQFVPGFVAAQGLGSGELRVLTHSGRFYEVFYYSDFYQAGAGSFRVGPAELAATLPVPNAGAFVYVQRGSPGFAANAILVAEPAANRIAAYDVDANGNPLVHTRRVFFSGLSAISGMTVDPITFDLLISTRSNSSSGIYRIAGFGAGFSKVISGCLNTLESITTSGVHTLAHDLTNPTNAMPCLRFRDSVNVTLDCGGKSIAGGISLQNVTRFAIRNCNLTGGWGPLSIANGRFGTITGNLLGGPSTGFEPQLTLFNVLETAMEGNQIFVRWFPIEDSQKLVLRNNQITATLGSVYLVESRRGFMNTFDANVLEGAGISQHAFRVLDENSSAITNNMISNFTISPIVQHGTTANMTISGNTVK
jgi:hypothetical protein